MREEADAELKTLDEAEIERRRIAEKIGYITEEQLTELAKASPATVEDWRKRRTGPDFVLLGNAYYYELSDVMEYLKSRKKTRNRDSVLKSL